MSFNAEIPPISRLVSSNPLYSPLYFPPERARADWRCREKQELPDMKERQHDNPVPPEEVINRVWELADRIDICMLTTWNGQEQHSRPMSARPRRSEGVFYFLTDVEAEKNGEISSYPKISLAWADNGSHRYAVVTGEAAVSNDRAKIADLWEKTDKIWWEDANDPTIRLLTVIPHNGEIWDSPNALVSGAKMLKAMVTGEAPELGDNASVRM